MSDKKHNEKEPDWMNMKLSKLIGKSLEMGRVPVFKFVDKNYADLEDENERLRSRIQQLEQSNVPRWVKAEEEFLNACNSTADEGDEYDAGWNNGASWAFDWLKKHFEELPDKRQSPDK